MKSQLKLPLPMHNFILWFSRVYVAFNFKTHSVIFVQRGFHQNKTGFFSFFLNSMPCHHIMLHGMLINVHETLMKPPLKIAIVLRRTLQVQPKCSSAQHFWLRLCLFPSAFFSHYHIKRNLTIQEYQIKFIYNFF